MKPTRWMIWMVMMVFMLAMGSARGEAVRIYPAPAGEPLSTSYTVTIDQQDVPVYRAKVARADQAGRYKAMDDKINSALYHDWASFVYFDMAAPVKIRVGCPEPVREAKLLPSSYGIKPEIDGNSVTITLDRPRHVTLEINGNWLNSLHLFANPPEADAPDPKDPNVIYFGPGIHEVDGVRVDSGKTVYIAGGAVVRGKFQRGRRGGSAVFTLQGERIVLRGRGIIDGGLGATHAGNMIAIRDAQDVRIEGVIVRDSPHWTVPIRRCDRIKIDNIKLIGFRANSDGIDICNSRNVQVTGCFMRTLDDLIVVKSDKGQGEVSDIRASGCVLWNEVAHALSIGAELRENVSRVRFFDCDVIHDKGREWALRVYHCDSARISDVVFENIRIEETRKLISLWISSAIWSRDAERGKIDGVIFRDITAAGDQPRIELKGFDEGHAVRNALFERVVVNGQPLRAADVTQNEFVSGVSVRP